MLTLENASLSKTQDVHSLDFIFSRSAKMQQTTSQFYHYTLQSLKAERREWCVKADLNEQKIKF